MWEPFSEPARRAVVRAQEVAQMFGSRFIGTEHLAFALAEGDDDVGHLFANALDRDAIRERLGSVSSAPMDEMVFSSGAKRAIENAFENARRLGHTYIGAAHLALGVLGSPDPPPLLPGGDLARLRAALERTARGDERSRAIWREVEVAVPPHPAAKTMLAVLEHYGDLTPPGTRVSVTIAPPAGEQRTWTWARAEEPER